MRIRTVAFAFTVLALVLMTPRGAAAQEPEEDTSSPSLRIDWKEFKKLYDAKAVELIAERPSSHNHPCIHPHESR